MIHVHSVDPTRTITLRNRYAAEMRRRFRAVKKLIRQTVVDNDALRLSKTPPPLTLQADPRVILIPGVGPHELFDFPTNPEKAAAFMEWLGLAVDEEVLGVIQYEGRRIVAHTAWQNTYIRSGYQAGVLSANIKLAAAGVEVPAQALWAVFNAPHHADAMGMLFMRNFEELKGITEAMSQGISRSLVGGMAEGIGPREMGRRMALEVEKIGVRRGTLLARTEVIRAHSEATLNRFEDFGVAEVEGFVELETAGDDRVCDLCEGLEGNPMPISEARGIIPVHPLCRCTWLPIIPEPSGVRAPSIFGFERRVSVEELAI